MKQFIYILSVCLLLVPTAFCATTILQEDFTPAQVGTLPTTLWGEWDSGVDVIVVSLATASVPVDHTGGDGYIVRLGDINDSGYNFCYSSDTAALVTDNAVESWVYLSFDTVTWERDYGVFLRCTPDPAPSLGGKAVYNDCKGYWFFVTINSSWGSYVPPNMRAFMLKRTLGTTDWVQIGDTGTSDYTTGWHKLRLEALGSEIKGYVDGNLEVIATDTDYTAGFAGMAYYNGVLTTPDLVGAFDNFKWERIYPALVLAPTGPLSLSLGKDQLFTASGGIPPFTFTLSNSTVGSISTTATSATFSALSVGSVDLIVSDSVSPTPQTQTVTINVVPTLAPMFIDADKVNIARRELFE